MWGSSFILIKKGLEGLSPIQVGAFRVTVTAVILIAFGFKKLKKIPKNAWKWLGVSGLIGTLLPSFLFAYAETEIDSAVASILNSTVPLLALIVGVYFFKSKFIKSQFFGVLIGLVGCVVLILIGANTNPNQNYWYAILPVVASLMYAFNANVIKSYLQHLSALGIAAGSFLVLIIPALAILILSGFFNVEFLSEPKTQSSMLFVGLLAILGTALAKIIFNRLIQLSDPVFSTSVTYLIPIVALFWGILDGESFSLWQIVAGGIILFGVYISNLKGTKKEKIKKLFSSIQS
jgi:drug/metabolite transporter (DMT)-like permease